ncbi:hypothetical protein A2634_05450 [Candidatus Amesbacteria bacterium RIFCSPHIGHO2_01_FULL_48_32]|uniref:Thioredoxin domain-containing protein n=1 Tax=Candidatus Amesbacteria bacterium RIFCSPLOWO2_01_FULL_48_25 TaxID=1797259 RepID=A0A1F4ZCS3_9BACT|nr:MAG: hypothetical protein A2634_05450 [Candidatus Amesbacteria bacterium RIFCSPHIGHO2_01_FULL_48_32]OGD04112.1 MAG: hypothetical protein A2989_01800 [Candidatus Amesbacteria bacterium RIFCSPLOWO2_01_FULL_48_25]OGM39065.1 MAG: hypothetical protein A3E13_03970 [Candidatus Woesebacteria bacterium RIFCSPHIGHO2_12_FULL_40_20]HJZ05621.1 thioredoxin family protein [Patescibacteria group bacterium]
MSAKAVILAFLILIPTAAAGYLFTQKPNPPSQLQDTTQSNYVDYTPAAFAAAINKRRVLYFYATWCPTCSVANEDFTVNAAQIPTDVVIFRTDYDRETTLKAKYGITYQHTFVQVDTNGNELAKWNGGGLNELINQLTN